MLRIPEGSVEGVLGGLLVSGLRDVCGECCQAWGAEAILGFTLWARPAALLLHHCSQARCGVGRTGGGQDGWDVLGPCLAFRRTAFKLVGGGIKW